MEAQIQIQTPLKIVREKVWENRNYDPVMAIVSSGYCNGHFEKGMTHKLYTVSYENVDGNIEDKFKDKKLCPDCLAKWVTMANDAGKIIGS